MDFLIQDIGRILVAWMSMSLAEQSEEADRADFDHE
jgi:hypothetical protein